MSQPAESDDPDDISDPVDRTQLAWTRTAVAFASIGAAMTKASPAAGVVVLLLSLPVWAVVRRVRRRRSPMASPGGLRLVTTTVVVVAAAALAVALLAPHTGAGLASWLRGLR